MEATLQAIRTDLRLSMNGPVAAGMRKMGISYRVIFGVDLPRLQGISRKYEPSAALAERLWSEDVRELKILATLLYPPGEMSIEVADRWVRQINNQELREQACKNLFEKLPFANEAVEDWSACEENGIRATGHWLFARLCIRGSALVDKVDSMQVLQRAVADMKADSPMLYQSALGALRFFGRTNRQRSAWVLQEVSSFESSSSPREREMYDQLKCEFDYSIG
ncbi:MAG: DNA alkylation repair protein [Bacteroidota bacterium]|jgi:3-methyladenine DNA glycosylase AlkD|nr:DNA alkylation repair protein [Bacteroidota bacterium]